jgi:hypothetical protein
MAIAIVFLTLRYSRTATPDVTTPAIAFFVTPTPPASRGSTPDALVKGRSVTTARAQCR